MKLMSIITPLFLVSSVSSYKILGVFHTSAPSHYIIGGSLMKALAEKGHEVTLISPFPQKTPLKNFRDIEVQGVDKVIAGNMKTILNSGNLNYFEIFQEVFGMARTMTNYTLQHKVVQDFIHSPNEQFDIVITEMFASEALIGLGHHFKAPTIAVNPFGAIKWVNDLVGTPTPMSYVAHPFLSFTDKMTFFQRTLSTLITMFEDVYVNYIHLPKQEAIYQQVFPDPKPSLATLRKNVSLVLLNTHFSLSFPRPYVPNMIEVGGMQVNRQRKVLPKEISNFLDSATHGVVYFSMGSNIRSAQLPIEKRDAILKTFSKLKQKVLWKWEEPNLPHKPDNVFISNWFPQDDILAHEKVKLFITHGGLLSSTEAIYHGVPIIGIPVFGDQELNMARAVSNGYGIKVDYKNLTETSLTWALNEMLNNEKYSAQAKLISEQFRDQPMTPTETAIYWVEYVARHKGAPHMRSAGLDLNWFAYHSLDVFGFLLAITILVLYAIKVVVLKVCCGTSKTVERKRKTKKN